MYQTDNKGILTDELEEAWVLYRVTKSHGDVNDKEIFMAGAQATLDHLAKVTNEKLQGKIDEAIEYLSHEIVVPITGIASTPYEFNAIEKYKAALRLFAEQIVAILSARHQKQMQGLQEQLDLCLISLRQEVDHNNKARLEMQEAVEKVRKEGFIEGQSDIGHNEAILSAVNAADKQARIEERKALEEKLRL